MSDYRRANFIPLSDDGLSLDYLSSRYNSIGFLVYAGSTYRISQSDLANLPGIADRLYSDINLWWLLAMYNGIVDPINDLVVGLVLRVPTLSSIQEFLARTEDTAQAVVI